MSTALPPFAAWLAATVLPLGAAWLLFRVVLRSERCFGYNRAVLLLAPLVAALLPLLPRPALPVWLAASASSPAVGASGAVLLPTLSASEGVGASEWAGWPWVLGLYGAGVALGLLRLARQLGQVRRAARALSGEEGNGYRLRYTGGRLPTSSFGKIIFWDETAGLSAAEAESVLAHERAHVRQGHSYDVLWLEIWRAVLWPNPFAHLLLPALRLTHELLADREAAGAFPTPSPAAAVPVPAAGPAPYAALLARLTARSLTAGAPHSRLLQPFTFSFTLTRLAMLQNQTPVRRWKQWLALPVLAGQFLMVASRPASAQIMLGKNASAAERQAWKAQVLKNVKKALHDDSLATGGKRNPDRAWHFDIKRDATVEFRYQDSPPPPPKLVLSPDIFVGFIEGDGSSALIPRRIAEVAELMAQEHSEPDKPTDPNGPKVYSYVEQMPELPGGGGAAAIVQAIQERLVYPAGPVPAGKERVFVSFTVNAAGGVEDIRPIMPRPGPGSTYPSPGPAYEAAVVAAIQQLPTFRPGQQGGRPVAVSYTVPVIFKQSEK